ncbi:MAG: nucleotide exchange factor GrpE [Spirochaetia bacterium]|nr:nucleotide exchange factor GrpE [Spirochaetia bacterium]
MSKKKEQAENNNKPENEINQEEIKKEDEQASESTDNKLNKEIDDLKIILQRERAEFLNYKKRVAQDRESFEALTLGNFFTELMPVLDSFDRMFASAEDKSTVKENSAEKFIEGINLIHKQLLDLFSRFNVEELNPVDKDFDPSCMEAVAVQESEDVQRDIVNNVFQKGYSIKNKVLRPAKVLVFKPKASNEKENTQNETNT